LRQRKEHGAVEFKCALERGLPLREQDVALGYDRAAIGLADLTGHGQEHHVARRSSLAPGERRRHG
jgi:hypothetical protein